MSQKFALLDADGFVTAFYASDIHSIENIPTAAVAIDDPIHALLLAGQCAGKRMALDGEGLPLLVDPAPPTAAELATNLLAQRDAALIASDGFAIRHMDEMIAGGAAYTLDPAQIKALLDYRKALRDIPAASGFPNVALPAAPDFIGAK